MGGAKGVIVLRDAERRTREAGALTCARVMRTALALGTLVVAALLRASGGGAQPTPSEYLGYPVGADRELADWSEITGYLVKLASASDRVLLDTLGSTTLGRPLLLLTISEPENLASLGTIRQIQEKLADPRTIRGTDHREALLRSGKTIVLITCAIHSSEVGSSQVPLRIAHRLATSDEREVQEILANTVVLLIPSLNPDGVDLVTAWYRESVGNPWEGAAPPFLYHHYVGHDNNRDWYAFTQIETRLVVEKVHNEWHPQIVHDIHQLGQHGTRFFVPPWIDPIEPNVDPLLVSAANAVGTEVAWSLLREGKKGVVVNAVYDAWTPARAYTHYHGGVRILSETASAKLATPLEISAEELQPERGFDPRKRSWNFPVPWEGGTWRLADILDYMESGAFAVLSHAARNREMWLSNFVAVGERAVAGWPEWPAAWVIPPTGGPVVAGGKGSGFGQGPWFQLGVSELIRVLLEGDVEVSRAPEAFTLDGRRLPAGSYVVVMRQPYGAFAQALLAPQRYPELRAYEDGPLLPPYDAAAHTLPLLFGVEAVAVEDMGAVPTRLEQVLAPPAPPGPLRELAGLDDTDGLLGLYQPWDPSIDEGWTRWLFDRFGVPYVTLRNDRLRGGELDGLAAVLLASIPPEVLTDGLEEGAAPPELTGGLGDNGGTALRRFVEDGGTLVALDRSVDWVIEQLRLPVRNLLADLEDVEYAAPGSLVRLETDRDVPMAARMPSVAAALLQGGAAFEMAQDSRVRVVARYAEEDILLSGCLQGGEHLAGRPAVIEIPLGKGRVVLFGVRPQYRGQSLSTLPLLFDSLKRRGAG
jgi:hypothetical protein